MYGQQRHGNIISKFICTVDTYNPPRSTSSYRTIHLRESHTLLDLRNRQRRVQALGARPRAVQDRVTAVQTHAVVQRVLAFGGLLVTRVGDPAVRLQQHGGAEVLLGVPPVRRARGAAAGAEDAFVQAIEFAAVRGRLAILASLGEISLGQSGDKAGTDRTSGGGVSRCRYGLMERYCL